MPKASKTVPIPLPEKLPQFGDQLSRIRKAKGFTQYSLADALNVSRKQIADYERNIARPNNEMLVRFAMVLKVSTDALLGLKEADIPSESVNTRFTKRLKELEALPEEKKRTVIKILDDGGAWRIKDLLAKKEGSVVLKEDEAMLHGEIVSVDLFKSRFNEELKYIELRYYALAKIANVSGISLKFRKMKARWGSFNKTKSEITLNKWLVSLPYELIDYVICHELAHYYELNHSKAFYNQLAKLYPDYSKARKAIKKYSDIV